jgi:hypothetical protein
VDDFLLIDIGASARAALSFAYASQAHAPESRRITYGNVLALIDKEGGLDAIL